MQCKTSMGVQYGCTVDRREADMHQILGTGSGTEGRMTDAWQLEGTHSALAEDLVQAPRILAMWHLHVLWFWAALVVLPAVATIPEGDRVDVQEAKRPWRQGALSLWTEFEQTSLPINDTTPLRGGNREELHLVDTTSAVTSGRQWWAEQVVELGEDTGLVAEDASEEDEPACLMQRGIAAEPLEGPWYELLEEMRIKLEGYGKGERNQVAGHLIRLLHHRGTDQARGLSLGQMGGRTALLTSLLVAMRDDDIYGCKVPSGDEKETWLRHVWGRIVQFVPAHPGSHEAAGRWPSHDMPGILPRASAVVVEPQRSPIPVEDSLEMPSAAPQERPSKRRMVRVEMSSGSTDLPNVARLDVPLMEDGVTVRMEFRLGWESEQPSPASTVALPGAGSRDRLLLGESALGTGMVLPPAAPNLLGTFGLSESDFEQLGIDWFDGVVTVGDVTREHGEHVAQHLLREWGEPGQCGSSPPPSEPPAGPGVADLAGEDVGVQAEVTDMVAEDDDATGLLCLWWLPVAHAATQRAAMEQGTSSVWPGVSSPIFGGRESPLQ